jgi:glutathione S-transferase
MRLAGIEHRVVHEDDPRKGPKKKCPWIEIGAERIGDSELIIEHLVDRLGVDPDADLSVLQRAQSLTLRRTFEAHFSQIYEHSFFVCDEGWPHARAHFAFLPALLRAVALPMIRSDFKKEAWIKGIGRHDPAQIAKMAAADIDAAAAVLGDQPYLFGDVPTLADCTVYGFLALVLWAPVPSSAQAHLRTVPRLVAYCERMRDRFWSEESSAAA